MQDGNTSPAAHRKRGLVIATMAALPTSLSQAQAQVALSASQPGPAAQALPRDHLAAARWLDQAAFGPTPTELHRVRGMGTAAWLAEQLAMPETTIEQPADNGIVRVQFLSRLSRAPDQLRQRVAYALGQVLVVSMQKNPYPEEVVPPLRTLSRHAFGNYRILGDVTISPQMGKHLDLANSNKPGAGSAPNESFAREPLQLFTTGTVMLNPGGRPRLDTQGLTVPAYDQRTVQQLALALTKAASCSRWRRSSGCAAAPAWRARSSSAP